MQISKAVIAVLLPTVLFIAAAFSQYPDTKPFKTLNVADGLPQSFISGLAQDTTGFVWIATRDGLARYDGKQFKIFHHIPNGAATLANNTITGLCLDKSSRLWIAYKTGDIDIPNTTTEVLFHFTKSPVFKTIYGALKPGHSIVEDAKGNTWLLGNKGGLFICNVNKKQFHFYSDTALGLHYNKITGIAANQGNFTLITDSALIAINDKREFLKVTPFTFNNPHLYNPSATFKDTYTFFRANGGMIIQDEKRLIICHPGSQLFTTIPLPEVQKNLNFSMTEDNNRNIFFISNGDIFILTNTNELINWKPKKENPPFGFISMMMDRSGTLWLGGNGSGIQLHDIHLFRFSGFPYQKRRRFWLQS